MISYSLRTTTDLCSVVLPANPKHRPSLAAVKRVERELIHRESKMQAEIIEIAPLMVYVSPCPVQLVLINPFQASPKQNSPLAVHSERTPTTESFTPIRSCLVCTTIFRSLRYALHGSYRPPQRSSRGNRCRAVRSLHIGEYGRSTLALSTETLAHFQDRVVPLCGESFE